MAVGAGGAEIELGPEADMRGLGQASRRVLAEG